MYIVLEVGIVLRKTVVSTLFATLLGNNESYIDTFVPVGSLANLPGVPYVSKDRWWVRCNYKSGRSDHLYLFNKQLNVW